MRRKLIKVATAVSLALLVAVFVLWVRSYSTADLLVWRTGGVGSARGRLAFAYQRDPTGDSFTQKYPPGYHVRPAISVPDRNFRPSWSFFGIRFYEFADPEAAGAAYWELEVPHAWVVMTSTVFPTIYVLAQLRQRRSRATGLCPACGVLRRTLMRSRVSTVVAVLSVLLAAAAIALWVRSYFVGEAIVYASRLSDDSGDWLTAPTRLYAIASTRGVLGLSVDRQPGGAILLSPIGWRYRRWQPEPWSGPRPSADDAVNVSFLGFHVLRRSGAGGRGSNTYIQVPFWFVSLVLLVPPAIWIARRGRRPQHACPKCGYDLRGSSNRCPECGTASSGHPAAEEPDAAADRGGG